MIQIYKVTMWRTIKNLAYLFIGLFVVMLGYNYYKRDFFRAGDTDFTFWKTHNGCYIIPYKYRGITPPKDEFILASNTCIVHIFIENDTIIHFFAESYMVEEKERFVESFLHSYCFEYTQENNENSDTYYRSINYYKESDMPRVSVFINDL